MKKNDGLTKYLSLSLLFLAVAAAAIVLGLLDFPIPKQIAGAMLGVGCGLGGMFGSQAAVVWYGRKQPAFRKEQELATSDERQMEINYRAKSKAYESYNLIYILSAAVFLVLNTGLTAVLVLTAGYLCMFGVYFVQLSRLSREM